MNIIIVDDEIEAVNAMQSLINFLDPAINILGTANSVASGLQLYSDLRDDIDVIFTDVEMQDGTGFDLVEKIGEGSCKVVFVTSYDRYAVKAFKFSAVDYLLKPVDHDDLRNTLEKLKSKSNDSVQDQLSLLLENINGQPKKIAIQTIKGFDVVDLNDIVLVEAERAYSNFHFSDGKTILSSHNLKHFEQLLPENDFCRVHKGGIVNLQFVSTYIKGDGGIVKMKNGKEVTVARRRKEEFLSKLNVAGI